MDIEPTIREENHEDEVPAQYIEPEQLSIKDEEVLLKEGLVSNIRPIELLAQPVSAHADQVFVGDIDKHADQIFEAEIVLPDGKKLLAVYKPDSGTAKGTETKGKPVPVPENSSPNSHKEAAAWIVARNLGMERISTPAIVRSIDGEKGSIRPYIYGKPLDLLTEDEFDQSYSDESSIEDIDLYDYLIQIIDRRDNNLVWEKPVNGQRQVKVIDHTLTFINEQFARRFEPKGPRLRVAFDNSKTPPKLKNKPLPQRLLEQLNNFDQNRAAIQNELSNLLNQDEIDELFRLTGKALEAKTFL